MKDIIRAVLICLIAASGDSFADYFPKTSYYLTGMGGNKVAHYQFGKFKRPFGDMVWRKSYLIAGQWRNLSSEILGIDGNTITELGSVLEDGRILSYYANNKRTGLSWSKGASREFEVTENGQPIGYQAYSDLDLIERLKSYKPAYGRCNNGTWAKGCGKVYKDVIHIVMYHGTKHGNDAAKIYQCNPPTSRKGITYAQRGNYASYAMEFYIANDIGIIEEITPWIESGEYWGMQDCIGNLFDTNNYHTYRD